MQLGQPGKPGSYEFGKPVTQSPYPGSVYPGINFEIVFLRIFFIKYYTGFIW